MTITGGFVFIPCELGKIKDDVLKSGAGISWQKVVPPSAHTPIGLRLKGRYPRLSGLFYAGWLQKHNAETRTSI